MFHPEGPTFLELARQALSSTERGYDLLAPKFDMTPFRTPAALLDAALPFLGPAGSIDSAVDLCCGTGAVMERLRPLCRERLVGVDFSRGMLAVARRNLASVPGDARIDLLRCNVLDFEAEAEFDLATFFSACGHVRRRDQARFVRLVARSLRVGGRFVFVGGERPPLSSPGLWFALAFDAAMAVRNVLWRPPFVMYYLNFLLPAARRLLEAHGFDVVAHRGYCGEYPRAQLVVATRAP